MTLHYQISAFATAIILLMASPEIGKVYPANQFHLARHQKFINSIVDGGKCNTFGVDKYVQNSDASAAYTATVKVVAFTPGKGSEEFQKAVSVAAGGKTYLGCSISPATGGPTYTYTVIGESKQ